MDSNQKQDKFKLFVENFIIYGFGSVIGKIIPLIMLPIITRLMPDTAYFGINDLSGTVASFGAAFAIMGMYDAMYRMFFEKEELQYKKTICSTTLLFTIITSLTVALIIIVSRSFIAKYVFRDLQYDYVVLISAIAVLVSATNTIVSAPTRMQNKRKVYIVTNTVAPIVAYTIAIMFIKNGYYIVALPLALLTSSASIEVIFLILNKEWFDFKLFDKELLKKMLVIAVPLLPNFLVYWLFTSCDKLMITAFIGVGAEGVYSIGAKLGHMSQLIYTAFAGGWQFFAFSTMKEEHQTESNSRVLEYLGVISFAASIIMFTLAKPIFKIMFEGDYVNGYVVAGYLFMAPLVQMLFQVAANQFLVIKKTWPSMFILMCGALVNVVLNYVLIPVLDIEGAAIATLLGYVVSVILCCLVLFRMNLVVITKRFLLVSTLTIAYILLWRLVMYPNTIISFAVAAVIAIIMGFMYREELKFIIKRIRSLTKTTQSIENN